MYGYAKRFIYIQVRYIRTLVCLLYIRTLNVFILQRLTELCDTKSAELEVSNIVQF